MHQQLDIVDRTFKFAINIVKLTQVFDGKSSLQRIFSSQILRSGTSIGANIEEGQAAESRADFIHKYNIALKEARETKYWLKLLNASNIIGNMCINSLLEESDEICMILAQIIINTKEGK